MSIATLKRKTQAKYNNMSVNSEHGFSLNGTRRSQGYIGQTSLSRSLPRTLMRGGVPRGHGGCCGTFKIFPVISSAVTSLNDPNIIKTSSINTLGMIETKYKQRLYHEPAVKPDNNQNINTQTQYVKNLAKNTVQCADTLKATDAEITLAACNACYNYNPFYKKKLINFTKPASNYVPISQGEYLLKLYDKCSALDTVSVPSANNKGVLPGPPRTY
jgi:hypothetical protein